MKHQMRAMVILTGTFLAGLAVFGWLTIGWTRDALVDVQLRELEALADARASVIDVTLEGYRDDARLVASRTRMRALLAEYEVSPQAEAAAEMTKILIDAAGSNQLIDSISLLDSGGRIVAGTDQSLIGSSIESLPASFGTPPPLGSPSLVQAIHQAETIRVVAFAPLEMAGSDLGTVQVTFSGAAMAAAASEAGFGRSGEILIGMMDADTGMVRSVIHSGGHDATSTAVLVDSADRRVPMVRALAGESMTIVDGAVDYDGVPVLAVTRHLDDLDWGLVAKIDTEEVVGRISTIRHAIFGFGAALTLAGTATVLFAARRSKRELDARLLAEDRFTSMFTSAPTATLLIAADGSICLANERAVKLLGYDLETLLSSTVEQLIPEGVRSHHTELRNRFLASSEARVMGGTQDVIAVASGGRQVPVEVSLTPIETNEGKMVIAALIDLTERNEAEADLELRAWELARSNRDLDDFAYAASHDLKAPVRAMESLAEFILQDASDVLPEQSRLDLLQIQGRSRRLLALVDGLLQYSRIGREEGVSAWVDTAGLVADIAEVYLPAERFEFVVAEDLPRIFAPEPAVQLVFRNLIMNVAKHHDRATGKVEIAGSQDGCMLRFTIADDGPGIAVDDRDRVFELFKTLETRDKKEASGLGLTMVKRMLDSHGGTVEVAAREGRGATFEICWPLPELTGRADDEAGRPAGARV